MAKITKQVIVANGVEDLERQLKDIGLDKNQIQSIIKDCESEKDNGNKLNFLKETANEIAKESFKRSGFAPFKEFILDGLASFNCFEELTALLSFMDDIRKSIPKENYSDFNALVEVVMSEIAKQVKLSFDDDFDKYYTV